MSERDDGPEDEEHVDADIDAIVQGKRYVKVIRLPRSPMGQGGRVGVIVLLDGEIREARLAALAELNNSAAKSNLSLDALMTHDPSLLDDERVIQILARCLVKPNTSPPEKFADKPWKIRNAFTAEQRNALLAAYDEVQREVSPLLATMGEGELDRWIERLGKAQTAPEELGYCGHSLLRTAVLSMARRLHASRTASSPSGSPSDGD